ncbi:MAG: polyphosphate kinase 1 [Nitrospiraceae bacterium]|nr:polyphosphate kinase 1 [Nitrospiraceae bacterium]
MRSLNQIREVSALSFNERVLQEAEDDRNPLMERLKFLGIFSSNMDEFFKVRVAGLHRRIELGKGDMQEVLEVITQQARELDERFRVAYANITSALAEEGTMILTEADIDAQNDDLSEWLHDYFRLSVLPSLVPIILRRELPFPQLTDGALYFGVKIWGAVPRYAILEIPSELPRFVELPNGHIMYIDDVIRYSLNDLFYIFDYDRIEAFEFKISRDAELDMDNDFSENYVRMMERELQQRKGGRPTRLVYDETMTPGVLQLLREELELTEDDMLIAGGRYHNMKDLMRFPNHRPDLSFDPMPPARHPVLERERTPMIETIADRDLLVTYPYQSFGLLIRLLREAAVDPDVEEIKMTVYRAADPSQVVNALVNAARNGKRITVSIELQARFDEQNNIEIAEKLSEAGANVIFGVPPMKVHSKLLLIRKGGIDYAGLSTGNFNEVTGRLYVDSTLLTADPRLTGEVAKVFDFLERASRMRMLTPPRFKHLLVSPMNTRKVILKHLAREQAKGADGYVLLKVNHLTDTKLRRRLRQAADAGVHMDLIVRTTYALRPHVNIRATSILDRFLEHQRVYVFGKGDDRRIFLSSADLMERNLDWRIEVAFPIYDEYLQQEVVDMMEMQLADNYKARVLDQGQSNRYVDVNGEDRHRTQYDTYRYFYELYEHNTGKRPQPAASAVRET